MGMCTLPAVLFDDVGSPRLFTEDLSLGLRSLQPGLFPTLVLQGTCCRLREGFDTWWAGGCPFLWSESVGLGEGGQLL